MASLGTRISTYTVGAWKITLRTCIENNYKRVFSKLVFSCFSLNLLENKTMSIWLLIENTRQLDSIFTGLKCPEKRSIYQSHTFQKNKFKNFKIWKNGALKVYCLLFSLENRIYFEFFKNLLQCLLFSLENRIYFEFFKNLLQEIHNTSHRLKCNFWITPLKQLKRAKVQKKMQKEVRILSINIIFFYNKIKKNFFFSISKVNVFLIHSFYIDESIFPL